MIRGGGGPGHGKPGTEGVGRDGNGLLVSHHHPVGAEPRPPDIVPVGPQQYEGVTNRVQPRARQQHEGSRARLCLMRDGHLVGLDFAGRVNRVVGTAGHQRGSRCDGHQTRDRTRETVEHGSRLLESAWESVLGQ